MLYEQHADRYADGNLNSDCGTEFYFDVASTVKRRSVDAKYEKKVTFARLFSRVSSEQSSEVNIDVKCLH